jgi:hypothetical protein
MISRAVRIGGLLLAMQAFVIHNAPLAAQVVTIAGRVVDGDGRAVADQPVVLHRVTSEGGTLLADARTDSQGRFTLETNESAQDSAVYFVASRYRELLYIGRMLRAPVPESTEYVLEVGVPQNALGAANPSAARPAPPPGSATGTPRRWLLLLVPIAGLVGMVVWGLARAVGPPEERRILIRLAQLDTEWEGRSGEADVAEYRRRRTSLLDRLGALS